ncbi:MAG: hypothetical protein V3T72_10885 [Thermoanaerobaculia bacterium]
MQFEEAEIREPSSVDSAAAFLAGSIAAVHLPGSQAMGPLSDDDDDDDEGPGGTAADQCCAQTENPDTSSGC